MLLNNLKFFERMNLKLVSRLFPVKETKILLLDKLEIDLKESKINLINIPSILQPQITTNFCFVKPGIVELKTFPPYIKLITCQNTQCLQMLRIQIDEQLDGKQLKIKCPSCNHISIYSVAKDELVHDFSKWLNDQLFYPEIESFSLFLNLPSKAGKSYKQIESKERQVSLFNFEENIGNCVHGFKKNKCSICSRDEKLNKEKTSFRVDPFDLIFPILQPPLGENFDNPIAFPSELYPFQRIGVKFLIENERALLGDEMGLGKSIQAIVAIKFLFRMGKVTNVLILCPKSVLEDWNIKLWDWAPELRVIKVRGQKGQRQICWNSPAHIYLTTYETVRQDLASLLEDNEVVINPDGSHTIICPTDGCSQKLRIEKQQFGQQLICSTCKQEFNYVPADCIAKKQFDLIILDEIQKIKNPGADITKATRQIIAHRRWGLSGTPLENRLEELISIFAYLKPGLLHYHDVIRPEKVKEKIRPCFLRRKSDALPEFPKVASDDIWLELLPIQREAYDKAEKEGIVALNEEGDSVTVQHILALITKLKQICNIDPVSKESCKFEYLLDKLEEISQQGDKVLVFSQYPGKTLKSIEPKLKQFNPVIYEGSLSDIQRDGIVEEFQTKEDGKVLLMSVKAGGVGLTLTRANHVYLFDHWWNPAVTDQSIARARRIGQKKTVFVTHLFTVDTIEERIQKILERKRKVFNEVIDDLSDTNLSRILTEEELFGLFNLQKKRYTAVKTSHTGEITSELLEQISPQQFEKLIADLYEKMGYQVRLTSQTRDQGIDVHAKHFSETGIEYLAIQCKHYPNSTVGVEPARSLYGVIQDQPSITKGVLVTSGEFSKDCREFASGKRIELFNGIYLLGLLKKYNISPF